MYWMAVQIFHLEGAMLSGLLKSTVSHCCSVHSKKIITASARQLQPTAFLLTGRCHINFSPAKNPPPPLCDAEASSQNIWYDICCSSFMTLDITRRHSLEGTLPPRLRFLSLRRNGFSQLHFFSPQAWLLDYLQMQQNIQNMFRIISKNKVSQLVSGSWAIYFRHGKKNPPVTLELSC